MLLKKPLLLLLLLFCCAKAFPATFTVTSNADSGPGTLHDALAQAAANGTAEKDYIFFNIADTSPAGRRINLVTELPDLTSNLVIDASTQPGAVIGKSGAHIQLFTPVTFDQYTLFQGSGLNDVEFYGLYMDDYTNGGVSDPDQQARIGVNISNSTNIIFGAPGKGNLFLGFNVSTVLLTNVNHVTFQGNVIGLGSSNTLSDPENLYLGAAGISLQQCNNILIGGDTAAEGNIVFSIFDIELVPKTTGINITIKWNNFGVYQDGKSIDFGFQDVDYVSIRTKGIDDSYPSEDVLATAAAVNADIENNLGGVVGDGFIISTVNGEVDFYNNFLGVSRDGTVNLDADSHADEGTPIHLNNCRAIINIGSNDPTKGNFLAYCTSTALAGNCPNVLVRHNEYECIGFTDSYGDPITIYGNDNYKGTLPTVSINGVSTSNGQSVLTGTATPGSLVDIFGSESCIYTQCSIRKFIETVTADANGKWKSSLENFSGVFYVSATKNNITSTFKSFEIDISKVVSTDIRCSGPGTITGIQVPPGLTYHWEDSNGKIVSNDLILTTNTPGDYQLVIGEGCIRSPFFHVIDNRISIVDYFLKTTEPSCGTQNGAITGLFAYDPENKFNKIEWVDAGGNVMGNSINISNLAAGSYTCKAFTSDGCEADYGPVILKNATGPGIDQAHAKIQATNCGQATGSITNVGIIGTGTINYSWTNSNKQVISTDSILTGQPGGAYKLTITDDTQCGAVFADFTIPEINGVTMDETQANPSPSSCKNDGSVTGIRVNGATEYLWKNANNNLVGTGPNLTGVPAGVYTLTASNTFGCSKTSQPYKVTALPPTVYPAYAINKSDACADNSTGSLGVIPDDLVASLRWVDSQGNSKSNPTINNLPAGNYSLYLTDKHGCETLYGSYSIASIPKLEVNSQNLANVTNDECNTKTGGINSIGVTGGTQPYTYAWADASGIIITTNPVLTGVGAGTYTLTVNDASGCGSATATFTIKNTDNYIAPPALNNIQLCSSGSLLITVNNASATATYNLYTDESSTVPAQQAQGGRFKVDVSANTSFYISRTNGTCESSKAKVDVTVGLSTLNIANTFTPNGDGINDYWKINNIENYPNAIVQVFTRYGQKIFESKGYRVPFDGTYMGKKLPVGVYYFIINLNSNCSLLSGSLTILR